jgi:hypothetical protein
LPSKKSLLDLVANESKLKPTNKLKRHFKLAFVITSTFTFLTRKRNQTKKKKHRKKEETQTNKKEERNKSDPRELN